MKLSSKTNELFSLLIVAIIGATAAVDNECGGPLKEITYRFNAGSCAETNALISQDLFSCEDSGNSLIGIGTYHIEASGSGESLYFAGPVAIGSEYTLNQDGPFDSLGSATIKVYTTQGGELLQTVTINDMTCNTPLFLFDKFGANQVTQWVETSGRVVTGNDEEKDPVTVVGDNDCQGPVKEITYRFNGGSCDATDALISRDLFSCEDPSGASIGSGTYHIEASGSGDNLYFAGPVLTGSEYTLNQDGAFDSLGSATIKVYTTQGGELLQTVTINDMTCNNPLFLFDTFGASQITKWTETSGRVVTSNVGMSKENAETDVDVDISTNNGGPEVMEAGPSDADISTSSGGVEVMEAGSSAATANTITATIAAAVVVTVASVITLI